MSKSVKVCLCITLVLFMIGNISNFVLLYHIIFETEQKNTQQQLLLNTEQIDDMLNSTTNLSSGSRYYFSFTDVPKCIIKDDYAILNKEQKQYIEQIFNNYFSEIWNKYGYSTDMPVVTFLIGSDMIDDNTFGMTLGNNAIILREDIFEYSEEEVENVILHELVHIAQDYYNIHCFFWLCEGMAEYITSEYSSYGYSFIPKQYIEGELYDGYEVAAGFLMWIENQKVEGTVMKLHRICQQGNMEYQTFEALTGQSLSDLWKEYSGQNLPSMEQYLLNYSNENYFRIANYYYFGYDNEVNYQKAWEYYQKATEQNDGNTADAYIMLADMAQNHIIENVEIQKIIEYYENVIDFEKKNDIITSKTSLALARLGDIYLEKEDIQAITWYEKAAEMGSVYAKSILGDIYYEGILTKKDTQKAYCYYLEVVESNIDIQEGKVYAMEAIADIFLENEDIQAIAWYEKAAPYDIYAQIKLGDIYFEGTLTKRDTQKAYSYYIDVIESGTVISENKAAYIMETIADICLENKDEQAVIWYEKAAPYDSYAQVKLGEIYYYGTFGKKDIQKARYYFTQVAENIETMQSNREYAIEMLDIID
ncbi:basic secretory protein-like protein [Clostridium sp. MD294]|uniref:basic secretory protein-like protein n=1 Tax=Clostridium sp. MD294 TaxID=97138 RepID=UPI0002CBE369|nr:basic secretory protein-like protein [Clostridium sp. MD294]NDO46522.1 hypothetical protein [Clostridium sp. MD294]USF29048.1 hypothetical protein C820_000431 [Clostridium sp. MD294]